MENIEQMKGNNCTRLCVKISVDLLDTGRCSKDTDFSHRRSAVFRLKRACKLLCAIFTPLILILFYQQQPFSLQFHGVIIICYCTGVMAVILWCLWQRQENLERKYQKLLYISDNRDKPTLQFESEQLYQQVDENQIGNRKYCVISFNSENTRLYKKILDDCFIGRHREKDLACENCVVRTKKDVLRIPACEVLLVFIDKTEDNSILETSGKSDDDLKLLTVKSCRKKKADVFVIYVGDVDSENLIPGLLYNPQITTITEHPELKEMEANDRVITCNRKFTISQRDKIADLIV